MLPESEIEEIVFQLFMNLETNIVVDGEHLSMSLSKDMKRLKLSTVIFRGDNFIPLSIRRALRAETIFNISLISTTFSIDEATHEISLTFTQNLDESGLEDFDEWLEDYFWIAREWRFILEKYGKEDLVFAYVNRR